MARTESRSSVRPAQAFTPGEYLREELHARGWSQADLARILGRPAQVVNEIVNSRKAITARTALELAAALDTSPQFWINLQSAYDLHVAGEADPAIAKRAKALSA